MALVINELEVAPAPAPSAPPPGPGGEQAQAEVMQKIDRAMQVEHERQRRLAAY